jgi:hypothetical protein
MNARFKYHIEIYDPFFLREMENFYFGRSEEPKLSTPTHPQKKPYVITTFCTKKGELLSGGAYSPPPLCW